MSQKRVMWCQYSATEPFLPPYGQSSQENCVTVMRWLTKSLQTNPRALTQVSLTPICKTSTNQAAISPLHPKSPSESLSRPFRNLPLPPSSFQLCTPTSKSHHRGPPDPPQTPAPAWPITLLRTTFQALSHIPSTLKLPTCTSMQFAQTLCPRRAKLLWVPLLWLVLATTFLSLYCLSLVRHVS